MSPRPSSRLRLLIAVLPRRYDNVVEHFRLPETNTSISPKANLVGMHIALEKITYLVGRFESAEGKRLLNLENEEARSFGHAPRRCDVYIGSFGQTSKGSMEDRVEIAGELWGAGCRADLMYDDAVDMSLEVRPSLLRSLPSVISGSRFSVLLFRRR